MRIHRGFVLTEWHGRYLFWELIRHCFFALMYRPRSDHIPLVLCLLFLLCVHGNAQGKMPICVIPCKTNNFCATWWSTKNTVQEGWWTVSKTSQLTFEWSMRGHHVLIDVLWSMWSSVIYSMSSMNHQSFISADSTIFFQTKALHVRCEWKETPFGMLSLRKP